MDFNEYQFDVRRLWDVEEPETRPAHARVVRVAKAPAAIVWLASVKPPPPEVPVLPPAVDAAKCLERTRAELISIATSLRGRDALRRGWMADRCGACRLCPEMVA